MPVQCSRDNGALLFLTQKVVVKINGNKECETAQGTHGEYSAFPHSLLSLLLVLLSPML